MLYLKGNQQISQVANPLIALCDNKQNEFMCSVLTIDLFRFIHSSEILLHDINWTDFWFHFHLESQITFHFIWIWSSLVIHQIHYVYFHSLRWLSFPPLSRPSSITIFWIQRHDCLMGIDIYGLVCVINMAIKTLISVHKNSTKTLLCWTEIYRFFFVEFYWKQFNLNDNSINLNIFRKSLRAGKLRPIIDWWKW